VAHEEIAVRLRLRHAARHGSVDQRTTLVREEILKLTRKKNTGYTIKCKK
jgi:hypothetical protein